MSITQRSPPTAKRAREPPGLGICTSCRPWGLSPPPYACQTIRECKIRRPVTFSGRDRIPVSRQSPHSPYSPREARCGALRPVPRGRSDRTFRAQFLKYRQGQLLRKFRLHPLGNQGDRHQRRGRAEASEVSACRRAGPRSPLRARARTSTQSGTAFREVVDGAPWSWMYPKSCPALIQKRVRP